MRCAVLVAAAVAALVLVAALAARRARGALARALAKKGWVVYVRDGCPPCAAQKKTLAEIGFTRVVRHDARGRRVGPVPPGAPPAPPGGMKAFPTWLEVPTGRQVRGAQSAAQLAVLAG